MSRFIDGPAAGVWLTLARAPQLLRVVCAHGEWDALDKLDDEPGAEETITVYPRVTEPTLIHVQLSNPRRGYWSKHADYRVLIEQPDRELVASTDAWRRWCEELAPAVLRKMIGSEAEAEAQKVRAYADAAGLGSEKGAVE